MKHYTLEDWCAYAKSEGEDGNVTELERDLMEMHLAECDECLDLYSEAIDLLSDRLPHLPDIAGFANSVAGKMERKETSLRTFRRSWYMQPIFHYAVAASLTIVLVGTGSFQQLFDRYSDLSRETEMSAKSSISEQWTDRAGQWLNDIPNTWNKKEGKP